MANTENLKIGDKVYVTIGSHYGPQYWEQTQVAWVSSNGGSIRDIEGRNFGISDVMLQMPS